MAYLKSALFGLFLAFVLVRSASAIGLVETEVSYHVFMQMDLDARRDALEGLALSLSLPEEEIRLNTGSSVTFEVCVEQPGFYHVYYEYRVHGNALVLPEGRWFQNGVHPFRELRRVVFPVFWQASESVFARDRFNQEIPPPRQKVEMWYSGFVSDATGLQSGPLRFFAEAGFNSFTLEIYTGSIDIKNVKLVAPRRLPTYEEYLRSSSINSSSAGDFIYTMHAARPLFQNATTIVAASYSGFDAIPYETHGRPLNMISEPSWIYNGEALFYEFTVPNDGYYNIAFVYMQSDKPNVRVFRTITINGETPFQELLAYGFDYSSRWNLHTLGDERGAFEIYLEEGTHVLGIEVDGSPYAMIIGELREIIQDLIQMNVELRRVIGRERRVGGQDSARDWRLENYFPDMESDLRQMHADLRRIAEALSELNMGRIGSDQQIFVELAINQLERLLRRPNEIPRRVDTLVEGENPISGLLQLALHDMGMQAMSINLIHVFAPDSPPEFNRMGFFRTLLERLRRFFATFFPLPEPAGLEGAHTEIDVWVTRTRFHVDTLQRLTDTIFTPETGIRVNYMLLMDESRLTLSAISGIQPDAAIGVSPNTPYEMGIRGMLKNLMEFDDFGQVSAYTTPGAWLRMAVEDRIYGMPETLDFNVLFYRRDIFEALNLPVPETWQEVGEIMPELHRNGMNFFTGLAGEGFKPIGVTAPFIWQHGGELFSPNGMSVDIDSPESIAGIRMMLNLSTNFGMSLRIPLFSQSFRHGSTPIGISGFGTYMELMLAAPELLDAWSIALPPGARDEDGNINRQYMGLGTSNIIFEDSQNHDAAWELLKWYMSDEIQARFAFELATSYGMRLVFNSANLEAFKTVSLNPESINIALEQWEQLREIQLLPGWYMLERELSHLWLEVVFHNAPPMDRLHTAIETSNREITRRMRDFGFIEGTEVIRDFPIITIEDALRWRAES